MATATKTRPTQKRSSGDSQGKPHEQNGGTNGQTNRPFQVLRRGLLKAVIWENQTANGPMFSTQLIRVYKDGDDWKETNSFNRDDLLNAAKMLDLADSTIHREEDKRRQQNPASRD